MSIPSEPDRTGNFEPGTVQSLELGTVERWAAEFVLTTDLGAKLEPTPPPDRWMASMPAPWRISAPGRPSEFNLVTRTRRSLRQKQLANPRRRAELLHTFLHHELQAAELMAWAILAFPETPRAFRGGLLAICRDEVRHLGLYKQHVEHLGYHVGDFPVRDWFWQRVRTCPTPRAFVALLGMGMEGCNLDHTRRFATWFREAGDDAGADLQVQVGNEEVAHVRFALTWFRKWTAEAADESLFEDWQDALVEPLSPVMFKGPDIDRERRRLAGLPEDFLRKLEAFERR